MPEAYFWQGGIYQLYIPQCHKLANPVKKIADCRMAKKTLLKGDCPKSLIYFLLIIDRRVKFLIAIKALDQWKMCHNQ